MSATRVRVCFEFRNGDGNYLKKVFAPHGFVSCTGESDINAIKAAFLVALQHHAKSVDELQSLMKRQQYPGHD